MFGRRRRVAPVLPAPAPETVVRALSDEQVFEVVQDRLAELIGVDGDWTLVRRQSDDTDQIFHGLKATEIAASLTALLAARTATRQGSQHADVGWTQLRSPAEPTALPWTPAPISVWAEPVRASVPVPADIAADIPADVPVNTASVPLAY